VGVARAGTRPDGEAEYEWRPDDIEDDFIRPNKELMLSLGKPITRSFPLTLDGFSGRQAQDGSPRAAIVFDRVADAAIRNSWAQEGTTFRLTGASTRSIRLYDNDLTRARTPCTQSPEVPKSR
jgi:hypothetical protein